MEVIAWQLSIIILIVVCWFVYRKAALWLALGLTGWTVAMVFLLPLIAIQLISIWGTWFVLQHFSKQRDIIKRLSEQQQFAIQKIPVECRSVLRRDQHRGYLKSRIKRADSVIVILSGWINDKVINAEFEKLLDQKLREGCEIYIGFGYEHKGKHDMSRGERALRRLEGLKSRHRNRLHIARFPTHQKLLVIDDVVVFGSHNWLSNSSFINFERSLEMKDKELAKQQSEEVIRQIKEHESGYSGGTKVDPNRRTTRQQ